MAEAKVESEPTMEEILASIRRIISDDNEPEKEKAETIAVLPFSPDERIGESEPSMPASFDEPDDDVLELTEIVAEEAPFVLRPESEFEPEPSPDRSSFPPQGLDDRLVSNATAAASSAAFASMSGMFNFRREGELPIGNGALTLEQMVKDLVRPLLRQWLDENLPGLVERLVQEEIRRIAREAQ